ncbi:class I SAM-dependent methyltransferase [Streptomyces sp. CB01201]|uniref:class I SAM-dependent methyltransferase n=1 Tax=Streptomyces sp. CB01201 TaxID=2020324 RepID=UPI00131A9D0D|nr:class I SAM-dependent methyltransferase [Streptomyces sp. CB01201]
MAGLFSVPRGKFMQVTWDKFSCFLDGRDRAGVVGQEFRAFAYPHDVQQDDSDTTIERFERQVIREWSSDRSAVVATGRSDVELLVRAVRSGMAGRDLSEAVLDQTPIRVGELDVVLRPTVSLTVDQVPLSVFLYIGDVPLTSRDRQLLLYLLGRKQNGAECKRMPAVMDVRRQRLFSHATSYEAGAGVEVEKAAQMFSMFWSRFQSAASRMNIYTYLPDGVDIPGWDLSHISWGEVRDVIDVGCGTGRHLHRLRRPGLRSLGVDPSPQALRQAIEKHPTQSQNVAVGNLMNLPVANESFDVVLAMHMLYNVPDIDGGLREVRRVLRRNGRFLAATSSRRNLEEFEQIFRESLEFICGSSMKTGMNVNPRIHRFNLENGQMVMGKMFESVVRHDLKLTMSITEPEAVIRYIDSTRDWREELLPVGVHWSSVMSELRHRVLRSVQRAGAFTVTAREGVFVCS